MDTPEIVYKYRKWTDEFDRRTLLNSELYLASPLRFNDPFDCMVIENYRLLDTPEKRELYISKSVDLHKDRFEKMGVDLNKLKNSLRQRVNDIEAYQLEFEQLELSEMDKHYGVVSLSARWDSILMWGHYAECHRGFCVGFSENKIRESGLFGKGGPITYAEYYPEISPLDKDFSVEQSFTQTHTKSKDWEYEREYRLHSTFYPDVATDKDRTVSLPDHFIEEVIIGLNTPADHLSEILNECNKRSLPAFQVKKVAGKFSFDRIRIN